MSLILKFTHNYLSHLLTDNQIDRQTNNDENSRAYSCQSIGGTITGAAPQCAVANESRLLAALS